MSHCGFTTVAVRVHTIHLWSTLCSLHKHPIYHSFGSLWKSAIFFNHKPTPVTWFHQFENQTTKKANGPKIYNGTSLPHLLGTGFSATKKYGSKTTNHSPLAWPFELHVKQTLASIACDWLIVLLSDVLSSCVWSCLLDESLFHIKYNVLIYYLLIDKLK